jgi:two-component system cell cycle response regulator DivK
MAKILVIEANAKNLKLAVFLLRKQGYEVFSAITAEDGIAIAKAEQPDLILMDIQLPGMDGIQATQALKAHASTQQIKIIALTAFAMDGDKQRILDAGCDGYISKPIRYQSFLADVHRFIGAD